MADTLDLNQINELREAFNLFDLNGKGVIKVKQLKAVMESLGQNLTKEQLQSMIEELDTDGDKCIDFPEFLVMLAREFNKRRIEVDVKRAFSSRELEDIKDAIRYINSSTDTSRLRIDELAQLLTLFNLKEFAVLNLNDLKHEFNNEGWIYFTQVLVVLARSKDRMESEKELREAFAFFDNDNDGLIGAADLKNSMQILGESISSRKIGEMIREGDMDGDGFLNEREFIAIMRPETKFIKVNI